MCEATQGISRATLLNRCPAVKPLTRNTDAMIILEYLSSTFNRKDGHRRSDCPVVSMQCDRVVLTLKPLLEGRPVLSNDHHTP